MPEYKDVDKNDMPKYLSVIEEMVLNCKHHFSFAALFEIIIAMYEYCLCYSYFYLNANVFSIKWSESNTGAYLRFP